MNYFKMQLEPVSQGDDDHEWCCTAVQPITHSEWDHLLMNTSPSYGGLLTHETGGHVVGYEDDGSPFMAVRGENLTAEQAIVEARKQGYPSPNEIEEDDEQ